MGKFILSEKIYLIKKPYVVKEHNLLNNNLGENEHIKQKWEIKTFLKAIVLSSIKVAQ